MFFVPMMPVLAQSAVAITATQRAYDAALLDTAVKYGLVTMGLNAAYKICMNNDKGAKPDQPGPVKPESNTSGEDGSGFNYDDPYASAIPLEPTPAMNTDIQNLTNCMAESLKGNAVFTRAQIEADIKIRQSQTNESGMDKIFKDVFAAAWKNMWSQFSKRIAYDTASWLASGGKGQQPLFVTQGFGPYMLGVADESVGAFIDTIDKQYGVNLCAPNLQIQLLFKLGLNPNVPPVQCRFSKMITNWGSAINDASFTVNYNAYLSPSENDFGVFLKLQTGVIDEKNWALFQAALKLNTDNGWQDVQNFAKKILTPGSMVKELAMNSGGADINKFMEEQKVFTGTVVDFINTFAQTLVFKLFSNLQNGYFSNNSDSSSGNSLAGLNLTDLSGLFNSQSQPFIEGKAGAAGRLTGIFQAQDSAANPGPYDIINKLIFCSDTARKNPGPTDCVIDESFASGIRNRVFVKDLPDSIKKRRFAPSANDVTNPQLAFTWRNIEILRKYRIVPDGWDVAAQYLAKATGTYVTLNDLISCFDPNDNYTDYFAPWCEGMIDPFWILKASELFCRRQGYGATNLFFDAQDGTIQRNKYCSDEQQCIKEDYQGNCLAYGYCTEERRNWDFNATPCEPKYNTCQTVTSRLGGTNSYLKNTLDFRYCNAQNAGCRWYSATLNPVSNDWMHETSYYPSSDASSTLALTKCGEYGGCDVKGTGEQVGAWRSISPDYKVILGSPCLDTNNCKFTADDKCTIPYGGIKCLTGSSTWLTLGTSTMPGAETIYFNRQVQACDGSESGCSQFIRAVPGVGSNLIPNSGFNIDENNNNKPDGWEKGAHASHMTSTNGQVLVDYDAETIYATVISVKPNTRYVLSVYAAQTSTVSTSEARIETQLFESNDANISHNNVTGYGLKSIATNCTVSAGGNNYFGAEAKTTELIFKPAGTDPERSSCWFETPATAGQIGIKMFANDLLVPTGKQILISDIQLEEVAYGVEYPSSYTDYAPSQRPSNQLGYVKKAPDYYRCYTTSTFSAWPLNRNQLEKVLQQRRPECSAYAGVCIPEEVGCEAFTPVNKDPMVPGVATKADLCPAECLNYQTYRQSETSFLSPDERQFIANSNLKTCSASVAGCDEFTNIDEATRGGESREYYSKLKFCQKPASDDSDYFTWEGSDTTGYQLKSYRLKHSQTSSVDPTAPCTVLTYPTGSGGANACKDLITDGDARIALPSPLAGPVVKAGRLKDYLTHLNNDVITTSTDLNPLITTELHKYGLCAKQEVKGYYYFSDNGTPATTTDDSLVYTPINPDCREFYDDMGNVSYRLLYQTIMSTNNCYAYRRTQTQYSFLDAQNDCDNYQGYWDTTNNVCIYMAVPKGGRVCSATAVGCREYIGNRGNNVQNVLNTDFESGADSWQYGTLSAAATYPGGSSFSNKAASGQNFGQVIRNIYLSNNRSYTLSFWVRGGDIDGDFSLDSVRLLATSSMSGTNDYHSFFAVSSTQASEAGLSSQGVSSTLAVVEVNDQWRRYELGPVYVDWGGNQEYFSNTLELNIPTGKTIFIDNVILKEVNQNIYAIDNSWVTPFSCDNKIETPYGSSSTNPSFVYDSYNAVRDYPGEMVGCSAYRDRKNVVWNLKSFERLCRPDAIGCEALIDTYNSDSPFGITYNVGDQKGAEVKVPADSQIYMVNDKPFECKAENMGCGAYGLPNMTRYDETVGYNTIFLKNQPDRYNSDLCKSNELWCEQFQEQSKSVNSSFVYFKDPRGKLCQYSIAGTSIDGLSNLGQWYEVNASTTCAVDYYQTIGVGNREEKKQPVGWWENDPANSNFGGESTRYATGWAGLCPPTQSSCTEYIDPLGQFYGNMIDTRLVSVEHKMSIALDADVLYVVSAKTVEYSAGTTTPNISVYCPGSKILSPDLSMQSPTGVGESISLDRNQFTTKEQVSGRFYLISTNNYTSFNCTVSYSPGIDEKTLQIAPAGVYYYLADEVEKANEGNACNGSVDFDNGCILVNNRSNINYSSYSTSTRFKDYLIYDTDKTYFSQMLNPSHQALSPQMADDSAQNNSDSIVKVSKNRQCSNWLYCNTYQKSNNSDINPSFGNNDHCLSIGACSSLGSNGSCNRSATLDNSSYFRVGRDSNKTGYSILGLDASSSFGYIALSKLKQQGASTFVTNGDFEQLASEMTTEPMGWYPSNGNLKWGSAQFSIESDPMYLRQGNGYLRLNGMYIVDSDVIDVLPGTEYYVSGLINTLNLKGNANVVIKYFSYDKGGVQVVNDNNLISMSPGQDWTKFIKKINTVSAVSIVLRIQNFGSSVGGYSMIDAIDMKPVLADPDETNDSNKLVRTCRIYPNENSPSCQYVEGSVFYYGQYGYCLVPDPLNPSGCLQWWPVDDIRGDVADEIGYNEVRPLYYCVERKVSDKVAFGAGGIVNVDTKNLPEKGKQFAQVIGVNSAGQQFNTVDFSSMVSSYLRPLLRYPFLQSVSFAGLFGAVGMDKNLYPFPLQADMYPGKACLNPGGIFGQAFCLGSEEGGHYTSLTTGSSGGGTYCSIMFPHCKRCYIAPTETILTEDPTCTPVSETSGECANCDLSNHLSYNSAAICEETDKYKECAASTTAIIVPPTPDTDWLTLISNSLGNIINGIVDVVNFKTGIGKGSDEWGGWGVFGTAFGGNSGKVPIGVPMNFHAAAGFSVTGMNIAAGVAKAAGKVEVFGFKLGEITDMFQGFHMFGMKVVTDEDADYASKFTDPIPGIKGDVLGIVWFLTQSDVYGSGVVGSFTLNMKVPYCSKIVRVVTAGGKNKAWFSRVQKGSSYVSTDKDCYNPATNRYEIVCLNQLLNHPTDLPVGQSDIKYESDAQIFGAVVPSGISQNPRWWSSQGGFPLFYQLQDTTLSFPYQPRMGQLHTASDPEKGLQQLFARSYGTWKWFWNKNDCNTTNKPDNSCFDAGGYYIADNTSGAVNWNLPTNLCGSDERPTVGTTFCLVKPKIDNVKINDDDSDMPLTIHGRGSVKLSFNVLVEKDQLPLSSYVINWGDEGGGESGIEISGASLRSRNATSSEANNQFVFYHNYDFWQMQQLGASCSALSCSAEITINATDNWGAVGTGKPMRINVLP
ncbi:MAG: hypothetical protein WCP18_00055 [bacterium]